MMIEDTNSKRMTTVTTYYSPLNTCSSERANYDYGGRSNLEVEEIDNQYDTEYTIVQNHTIEQLKTENSLDKMPVVPLLDTIHEQTNEVSNDQSGSIFKSTGRLKISNVANQDSNRKQSENIDGLIYIEDKNVQNELNSGNLYNKVLIDNGSNQFCDL